jgi:hypothetical protein
MEETLSTKNDVTAQNVHIGMAVDYYRAPKAVKFATQVISSPRMHKGELCVTVAMIGEPVPLSKLKKSGGQ